MNGNKHIGHQVIAMMDRLGVAPITRNYHLFYVCLANSNSNLRQAIRNLGRQPTQQQLDQVIEEHTPEAVDSYMMRRHENAVLRAIDDLAGRIRTEQTQMTGFNSAIERVSMALARSAEQEALTSDLLMKVVSAVGQAGSHRAQSGQRTLQRMSRNRTEVDALKEELVKVRRMANTDVLTGLANRRHFDERLAAAVGRNPDFSLMLCDIDHFKSINDVYGHAFGDHVLKSVAMTLTRASRSGTFIARTGGEEFAVVLVKANEEQVRRAAERIRQTVEGLKIRNAQEEVRVTISVGMAMAESVRQIERIYEAADAALYQSKDAGRNCVTMHDPTLEDETSNRYKIYANERR